MKRNCILETKFDGAATFQHVAVKEVPGGVHGSSHPN